MDLLHAGAYSENTPNEGEGEVSETELQGQYWMTDSAVPEKSYSYYDSISGDGIKPIHGRHLVRILELINR